MPPTSSPFSLALLLVQTQPNDQPTAVEAAVMTLVFAGLGWLFFKWHDAQMYYSVDDRGREHAFDTGCGSVFAFLSCCGFLLALGGVVALVSALFGIDLESA